MDLAFINDFRQFAVTKISALDAFKIKAPKIDTLCQLVTDLSAEQVDAVIEYLAFIEYNPLVIINLIKAHYPLEREACIAMASHLTHEELKSLIFDVRILAATETNQRKPQPFHIKLNAVIDTLAVMATADEASFITVVAGNKPLANMLFNWQYHPQISAPIKLTLVNELLDNYDRYDWSDDEFKRLCLTRITEVMDSYAPDVKQQRFKRFVENFSPIDAVALLDKLLLSKNTESACLSLISALLPDARDMIIINFFSTAQNASLDFKKQLLSLLSIERLVTMPNHIMALDYFFDDDLKILSQHYCQILKEKIQHHSDKTTLLSNLVDTIVTRQKDAQILLVDKLFLAWKDDVQLSASLIQVLIQNVGWALAQQPMLGQGPTYTLDDTLSLNAHLYNVLIALLTQASMFWSEPITRFDLLDELNPEASLAFYLYVLQHHPVSLLYLEVERYFQDKSRHETLIKLITNTPTLHTNFLENLFYYMDDVTLIKLINTLNEKIGQNPAFEHTFKTCLMRLSERLETTYDEKAAIHQWQNEALLAKQLLLNPECLSKLCERATTAQSLTPSLLQGLLVASAETDLKLRIHKCLKLAILDDKDINMLAYQWLTYFQHSPTTLQQCFLAIETISPTLVIEAKNNYSRIKTACYQLLHPETRHMPTAAETVITECLTKQLCDKNRFDSIKIRNIEGADKDNQLTLFEQLEGKDLEGLQFKTMVNLLMRAVDPKFYKHWERIADYINGLSSDHCFTITTTLITLNTDNNPIFNQKCWNWLKSLTAFDEVFPELDNGILQWLFKNTPEENVLTLHPLWLTTLIAQKKDLDIGQILLQLPHSPQILYNFYQNPIFTHAQLTTFFISLSQRSNATTHKIAIVEAIKQKPDAVRPFLYEAHLKCNPTKLEGTTAYALTHLLMSLPLKPNNDDDVELVLNYVDFLTKILTNPNLSIDETLSTRGLQQLLSTLLSHLRAQDNVWDDTLHRDETFNLNLLKWLKFNHDDPIKKQFLTQYIVEQSSNNTHSILINTDEYQDFVQRLLSNPPTNLTEHQFGGLFETLLIVNQHKLANTILKQKNLADVQMGMLFTLSNALSTRELYYIFEISETKYIFVDLIFRKEDATTQLTDQALNELLSQIKSGRDITRLLNSYNPISTKNKLVRAYFNYLRNAAPLPTIPASTVIPSVARDDGVHTLNSLFLDGQSLVLLANYTTKPCDKEYLNKFILANEYQKDSLNVTLRAPLQNIEIQPESYLAKYIRTQWLNPWQGSFVHANYLTLLSSSDGLDAIKRRVLILNEIDGLTTMFQSLSNAHNREAEALLGTRYIHKMNLVANTFLDIYLTWKTTKNTKLKASIEKTKLFQALISPLSQGQQIFIDNFNNQLVVLIEDYVKTLPNNLDDAKHKKQVKIGMRLYQNKLGHIKNYSATKLWNLFSPKNSIAAIKNQALPQLHKADTTAITEALKLHQDNLAKLQFNSDELRHELLRSLIITKLIRLSAIKQLVFDEILSQPIFLNMDINLCHLVIHHFSPDECLEAIKRLNIKLLLISQYNPSIINTFRPLKHLPLQAWLTTLIATPMETLNAWYDVMAWLNCHHFLDLILMAMMCQKINFEPRQLDLLLLPGMLSANIETEALNNEIELLSTRFHNLEHMHTNFILTGLSLDNQPIQEKVETLCQNPLHASLAPNALTKTKKSYKTLLMSQPQYIDEKIAALTHNPLLPILSEDDLATIIESYQCLFTQNEKFQYQHTFVKQLTSLLSHPKIKKPFLKHLSEAFKTHLVNYALTQLSDNEFLLFSLISEMSQAPLMALINPQNTAHESSYAKLRLNFALQPPENFAINGKLITFKNPTAKTLFLADAAFFYYWTRPDSEKETSKRALTWFQQNSMIKYYAEEAENYEREQSPPNKEFLLYWLKLYYFLALTNQEAQTAALTHLVDALLRWTKLHTTEAQFKQDQTLHTLLSYMIEMRLIPYICQTIAKKDLSEAPSFAWILHHCLDAKPLNDNDLTALSPLCDPNKVIAAIKSDPIYGVRLIKGLLQANLNIQQLPKALDLFNALRTTTLDYNALIDCLSPIASDSPLQTLIASHLLMQQTEDPSYFKAIQTQKIPTPSPHQAIIQRINLNLLPEDIIKLLPETVLLHLLISVQTYTCLTQDKMKIILSSTFSLQTKTWFIPYWLEKFQTAPNFYIPLISLFNLDYASVLKALKDAKLFNRSLILQTLMNHCETLTALNDEAFKLLIDVCEETELTYAIERYLSGAMQGVIAKQWINKLTDKILLQSALESNTIRLLIELSEKGDFTHLKEKISFFTGNTLRHYAEAGDVSLFYRETTLNINRLHNILSQNPGSFVEPNQQASKQLCFGVWRDNAEYNKPLPLTINDKIIKDIALFQTYNLAMRNIDYFLIHFKKASENTQPLKDLLTNYLTYFEKDSRYIRSTLALLTFQSVSIEIRNTIFNTLYQKHNMLNAENAPYFLFHNTQAILKYYGKQKDYETVIMLSQAALKKHGVQLLPESLTVIKQAIKEAKLELAISQFKRFITVRTWFWRCWTYGFTGWFKPKSPIYVEIYNPCIKAKITPSSTNPPKAEVSVSLGLKTIYNNTIQEKNTHPEDTPWSIYFKIAELEKRQEIAHPNNQNYYQQSWLYSFFSFSTATTATAVPQSPLNTTLTG